MSLQGLISGSECAVPFNPLSQLTKHTEGDRSVQQDRIAGPSSSRPLQHLPSTSAAPIVERDVALARQFFDGNISRGSPAPPMMSPPLPLPEMGGMMQVPRPAPQGDLGRAWMDAQERMFSAQTGKAPTSANPNWASEFGGAMPSSTAQLPMQPSSIQQQGQSFYQNPYMASGMYNFRSMGTYPMTMDPSNTQVTDKGKGKSREMDFEAAFAQMAESLEQSHQQSSARIEALDDTADLAAAMAGSSLQDASFKAADQTQDNLEASSDFKSVWNALQESSVPPSTEDMARWEAEYNQLMNAEREENDYGDAMQNAWSDLVGHSSNVQFDDTGLPILGDYQFETENRYADPSASSSSLLRDAKAMLEQGGSLTEVALMIEAAIQKGDLGEGGYEAWLLLGEVRSMDEREEQSMRALMEGVKRAEAAGAAGAGMMSLAISFTNESYERGAHTMLLRWLHATHPSHPIPEETWKSLSESAWHSHDQVTQAFLNLAQQQFSQGNIDPDVQIGLGVLFYSNGQYDRAKDCFETALSVRPEDYLLWNRLGSCLSNGNKPEEALGAYRHALQLRPTYTRAIYNVGVACLNIGLHKEAAEHFLSALAMQESSGSTKSDQVWLTLRRTLVQMERGDLADLAKAGTDMEVFRREGFDF